MNTHPLNVARLDKILTHGRLTRAVMTLLFVLFFSGCTYMGTTTVPYAQLAQTYINGESQYMELDGVTIHYRDEGQGPPLLLLHGVASSLHTWDAWVEQLKDQYRVIRLDLPGFGMTGPDQSAPDYEADYMVDKLNRFTERLGIQKFFLVGNSLGGYYAWNYAAQHPDKLYKLVLMNSAGYPQDVPFWIGFASWPVVNWVTPYMMPKPVVNWTLKSAYADPDKISEESFQRYFDLTLRQGNRASYIKHFMSIREKADDQTVADRVKHVMTPTLLMWGEMDEWIPLDVMQKFHRDLPDSEYIVYEGVGHLPMEELPVQSARDADHFFMSELQAKQLHPQEVSIKYYSGNAGQTGQATGSAPSATQNEASHSSQTPTTLTSEDYFNLAE